MVWTDRGLFCPDGDFYIDPRRPVERAVITHAHSDHARRGSRFYFCSASGVELLKCRLGQKIAVQGLPFGESFQLGGVQVSLHPAGHILGSAQVRVQRGSEVWAVSGDFKRDPDPSCEPFEVVQCDTWITEATFGTPKYVWDAAQNHGEKIMAWWEGNRAIGRNSLLFGYSLGKAQRILAELAPYAKQPVVIHGAMEALTQCYRDQMRVLAPTRVLDEMPTGKRWSGELILAPPSVVDSQWAFELGDYETAFASGWMLGSQSRWRGVEKKEYSHGFVMSDHADWPTLNRTIDETGATRVYVLHRGLGALVRHLRKRGIDAYPVSALDQKNWEQPLSETLPLFQNWS